MPAPPKPYVADPNGRTTKLNLCSVKNCCKSSTISISCEIRWAVRNIRSIALGIIVWVICSTLMLCMVATVFCRTLIFTWLLIAGFPNELFVWLPAIWFADPNETGGRKLLSSTLCHRDFRLFLMLPAHCCSVLAFTSFSPVPTCRSYEKCIFDWKLIPLNWKTRNIFVIKKKNNSKKIEKGKTSLK